MAIQPGFRASGAGVGTGQARQREAQPELHDGDGAVRRADEQAPHRRRQPCWLGEETVVAEINRIDPIYVYFTINERDLLRVTQGEGGGTRKTPSRQNTQDPVHGAVVAAWLSVQGYARLRRHHREPADWDLTAARHLPNPDDRIVPGLFRRVRAPYTQVHNAILVPAQAVGFDQQGNYVLTVNDKNIVERRAVETGEQIAEKRVITSGLKGDERLIVEGLLRAIPGMKSRRKSWASGSVPAPRSSPASSQHRPRPVERRNAGTPCRSSSSNTRSSPTSSPSSSSSLVSFAYTSLPVAQYPEIVPPTIQVTTSYPGGSAEVVATTVGISDRASGERGRKFDLPDIDQRQ